MYLSPLGLPDSHLASVRRWEAFKDGRCARLRETRRPKIRQIEKSPHVSRVGVDDLEH